MKPYAKYGALFLVIFILAAGFTRAGDVFLDFIGRKIHIKAEYKNHSGIISCFLLRSIALDEPVFKLEDFDLALGCRKAFIRPGFKRLLANKAILLKCDLENAFFLSDGFMPPFNGGFSALFERLTGHVFENMQAELFIYGETIEFRSLEMHSKDITIYSYGTVNESGSFDIDARIYLSPEIVKSFPEELKAMLTEESRGYLSYHFSIEGGKDKSFLKLESDRFRLNFERLDIK